MSVPQYKINVHIASILSFLGLPIRAEEPFYVNVAKRTRRIPDFVLTHSVAGAMIGEAEIGDSELDPRAIEKLQQRVYERFSDITFKGFDFIMLIIYPKKLGEEVASLPEAKVERILMEKTVGLGIAVRGDAFQLEDHYIRWYSEPVKVINIPQILNTLIIEFFKKVKERRPEVKISIYEFVESVNTIIENTARSLSLVSDQSFIEKLANVARRLGIAWDQIKEVKDRISISTKFILLMSTLMMIFYEIVRNERLYALRLLECDDLSITKLVEYFEELIMNGSKDMLRYAELNAGFIEVLKRIPVHAQLNNAIQDLCREVKRNYILIKRMGWDILSMFYQRLLSETYRHAFATFYTKLPAARLLASLAVEKFDDEVIDPASGTGSLLLATVERRRMLFGGEVLRDLYKKALESGRPLLDIVNEIILRKTAGLDALKPACFIAALNLRIATQGSSPNRLEIYEVPVGVERAGSLDLLTTKRVLLPKEVQLLGAKKYDVVIMNPPFTRSDRISYLIGEDARRTLLSTQLYFGTTRVGQLFTAGMAKPFMVLADKLVKEGGRIAAVLPNSILSRPSWKDVRKELLKSYNIEYIVISWAPGTPNFSSDTQFREILLVARKRTRNENTSKLLKVINLYKKVDELTMDDIEKISRIASKVQKEGVFHVLGEKGVIASIVSVDLEKEVKKRIKGIKVHENELKRKITEKYEELSNNLYRFIAFRSGEILKLHLDIVIKCGVRFGEVFRVGSVVDHTTGLSSPIKRNERISLPYETPALWGSGETLNVTIPWLSQAPFKIGVSDETKVRVKYWRQTSRTFYSAKIFIPRKIRLSTQYVLMIYVDEPSISNVWWPLEPIDNRYIMPYLVYVNSVFGFINILGERLETEGLYMEIKKKHLMEMPILDLRNISSVRNNIVDVLKKPLPRFDQYIEFMAKLNEKLSWYDVAQTVIEKAKDNHDLRFYANRALLDLESFRMLCEVCKDVEVPDKLYVLLKEEINALQQIMEHNERDEDIVEDVAERVKRRVEYVPLDKWLKTKEG